MFCVIQEIQRKKPNEYGHHRELGVYSYEISGKRKYYWRYADERFERPIRTAYKVSIHESKRVQGVVTKKQYPITTAGYYDLAEYSLYDCIKPGKLASIADALDAPEECLWEMLDAKMVPLLKRIEKEFKKSPEGKTRAKHQKILNAYQRRKQMFAKAWGVREDEYDYCYDLYGNVMNQAYIDALERAACQRERAQRSYQKTAGSNYSYDYSKLFGATYSDEDKARLKKFYKSLSKIYHPDMNPEADTHAEMVLLNKLKEEWGV